LRKLLVRYEKFERSFLALNHIAAAISAFRKVPLSVKKALNKPSHAVAGSGQFGPI
jgi:hypothetical protein